MAIDDRTLRLAAGMRLQVGALVDDEQSQLLTSWTRAWNEVAPEWEAALNDLAATSRDGKWPTRTQIARAKRAQQALEHTTDALTGLARDMDVRVLRALPRLTGLTATWQARIIGAQMPGVDQTPDVRLGVDWDRVDPKALDAIVTRAAGQVQSRSYPLAPRAVAAMKSEIIRGIAVGDNPRVAAARMLARVEGHFNGGLTRALVIARTEMLDAHREASRAQRKANTDVLTGWTWVATLDARTCFPAGTLITTRNGEKPIEHIQPGDVVLTHTGSWRKAYEPMSRNYSGKMVTIEANGLQVTCTSDHPILIERQGELQWMEARGVRRGDSVLSHRESRTDSADHVLGQWPIERGRCDAKHGDASALHEGVFAGIPVSGPRVPVGFIDFDGQPRRGQEEVQRTLPPGHGVLLDELDAEDGQSSAHVAFGLSLAGVTSVAPRRAEAAPVRRDATERCTADGAVDHLRGPATFFRAVGEFAALRVEDQAARLARRVGRISGRALDAAVVVARSVGARDVELDATSNAGLGHAAQGGHAGSGAGAGGSLRLRLEGLAAVLALPLHFGLRVAALSAGMLALVRESTVVAAEPTRRLASSPRRRDLEMGSAPLASDFHRHIVSSVATQIQQVTVYNFEVEGDHSYVANGIAVHNCPSCWSMHGSVHGVDEPGPLDHQQGRCAAIPAVKPWADLGFDIDEPASVVPDARAIFDDLPLEQQTAIMGAEKLKLLQSGQIEWADLSTRRSTDGWRDSIVPTPLSTLLAKAS